MREPILRARCPTEPVSPWCRAATWWTPWVILGIAFLARLPAIACQSELDVDESGLAAAGMRYALDFIPWRAADITTSGPLNCLAMRVVDLCVPRLTYRAIHVAAAALQCAMLLVTWMTLRLVVLPPVTLAATGCSLMVLACAQEPDYVHFSSELVPILLLSCAAYCVVKAIGGDDRRAGAWWAGACFFAGLAPWAKLQAAPISLAFWGYAVFDTWRNRRLVVSEEGNAVRRLVVVTAAFMLPTAIIVAMVCAGGAWQDLWRSYILRNLLYSEDSSRGGMLKRAVYVFLNDRPMRALLAGGTIFCAAWCACRCAGWLSTDPRRRAMTTFFGVYSLTALFAVVKPPWAFPHYEWLLFNPVVIASALVLDVWWRSESAARDALPKDGRLVSSPASSIVCYVALMVGMCADLALSNVRQAQAVFARRTSDFVGAVTTRVRHLADDTTTLGVWGWAPVLHVTTGLPPATRYAIGHYLLHESPQRAFFRTRYLDDLMKSMPQVFVDAVAPGFFLVEMSQEDRIASFPELARFLDEHYRLADEISRTPDDPPVRIYVRRQAGARTGASAGAANARDRRS